MPVLLATDSNTDMGRIAEREAFGFWCQSGDLPAFIQNMDRLTPVAIQTMGRNGARFLADNYTAAHTADIIESAIK